MKYILLVALLSLTGASRVPDSIINWCKAVKPVIIEEILDGKPGEARYYSRRISINREDFEVVHEDHGDRGRSRADILRIEGRNLMYLDEKLDGVLDGGEDQGYYYIKSTPGDYFARGQEEYSKFIENLVQKIKESKNQKSDIGANDGTKANDRI